MKELTILRQMILTPNLPFEVKPLVDITDTLPKHPTKRWGKRESTRRIIVHHSAVEGSIRGHANYHVNTKGRAAICYHTVIKTDQAYQTNDWADQIDHAYANNEDTISVCVDGDFTKRDLTNIERNTLYAVILTYMDLFKVDVGLVLGHGEVRPTSCPGFDMKRVRKDIFDIQQEIAYQKSAEYMRSQAFDVYNAFKYLYNLANGKDEYGKPVDPGKQKWAIKKLLELAPAVKDAGLMK